MTLYSNGSVESREAHKVVSSGEAHKKLSYKHCLLGGTLGCLRVSALKKPLIAETRRQRRVPLRRPGIGLLNVMFA